MIDPYVNLAGAIILQAVKDLDVSETTQESRRIKASALNFLKGKGLDDMCDVFGLDAEYIRRNLEKNVPLLANPASKNA